MKAYDRNKTMWETQDNRKILIKDINVPHLVNIINWVKQNPKSYSNSLLQFMEDEARYRMVISFSNNDPIPHKKADGWWIVSNITPFERHKAAFFKHKATLVYYFIRKSNKISAKWNRIMRR